MSLKTKPQCTKCEKTNSQMWTQIKNGVLCLECVEQKSNESKAEFQNNTDTNSVNLSKKEESDTKLPRRSTRSTRYYKTRLNPLSSPKLFIPKGKGRRILYKKTPIKAPAAVATPITSDSVFYKGSYFQIGDVVSMIDEDDDIYYAQIRGFLTDQYCEKSAVVTWLLPTEESPDPSECFDPATYIIGPEEEIPRKLECMQFIMHAPSEYFKAKNTPYPHIHVAPSPGFIWTSLRPVVP